LLSTVLTQDEDRYLRLPELARYSTLLVRTLQRCIAEPVYPLPAHRFGRLVLVRKTEFDAWVRTREARAAAVAPAEEPLTLRRRVALELRGYPVNVRRTRGPTAE
jgi:excisionase family DNA binding protein